MTAKNVTASDAVPTRLRNLSVLRPLCFLRLKCFADPIRASVAVQFHFGSKIALFDDSKCMKIAVNIT